MGVVKKKESRCVNRYKYYSISYYHSTNMQRCYAGIKFKGISALCFGDIKTLS